jgi:hypothetical protein
LKRLDPGKSKKIQSFFFDSLCLDLAGIWWILLCLDQVWKGERLAISGPRAMDQALAAHRGGAGGGVGRRAAHGAINMKDPVKKPPRTAAEKKLDEEIEESFPASDPPANTPTSVGSPPRPQAKRAAKGKRGRRG